MLSISLPRHLCGSPGSQWSFQDTGDVCVGVCVCVCGSLSLPPEPRVSCSWCNKSFPGGTPVSHASQFRQSRVLKLSHFILYKINPGPLCVVFHSPAPLSLFPRLLSAHTALLSHALPSSPLLWMGGKQAAFRGALFSAQGRQLHSGTIWFEIFVMGQGRRVAPHHNWSCVFVCFPCISLIPHWPLFG